MDIYEHIYIYIYILRHGHIRQYMAIQESNQGLNKMQNHPRRHSVTYDVYKYGTPIYGPYMAIWSIYGPYMTIYGPFIAIYGPYMVHIWSYMGHIWSSSASYMAIYGPYMEAYAKNLKQDMNVSEHV